MKFSPVGPMFQEKELSPEAELWLAVLTQSIRFLEAPRMSIVYSCGMYSPKAAIDYEKRFWEPGGGAECICGMLSIDYGKIKGFLVEGGLL